MTPDKEKQDRSVRIPLLEEDVEIAKRIVDGGSVTVQTSVDEKVEWVRETLIDEEVSIERVPIGQEVNEPPRIREQGRVTIIPIVREVLHVEKRLMLVEELHITRQQTETTIEKPVTLRNMKGKVTRKSAGKK